jgi:hypothetical protein
MEERIIEWQRFGETVMHPAAAAATVTAVLLVLVLPRRHAIVPVIGAALFLPELQRVVIAGLDFNVMRIMVVCGLLRLTLRGEISRLRLTPVDGILFLWTACGIVLYTCLIGTYQAFVNRLGGAVNGVGLYLLFRWFVRDFDDVRRSVKALVLLSLPIAAAMVLEQCTGRNPFGALGGVPEFTVARDGRLRAQAAFAHAILAGTFGASLVPLCAALWPRGGSKTLAAVGLCAATVIVFASSSSGPVLSYIAGIAALCFWCARRRMRLVRWAAASGLVALHVAMKAPVWALINRVGVVGGSTGYHRYILIDQFIRHFGAWWLCGSTDASAWGWGLQDITNHYVRIGLEGGLATLALFCLLIAFAFRGVGIAVRALGRDKAFFCWGLGAALFVHVVSFMGVSYFDQIVLAWYLLLCWISTAHLLGTRAAAAREREAQR